MPNRVPIPIAAPEEILIDPDLYTTVVNVGWSPVYVNFEALAAVSEGGQNIMIPAKGYLPNVPPSGRSKFHAIADSIPSILLVTFSREPAPPPEIKPDGLEIVDDFDLLCGGDPAEQTYNIATTFVGLGGHRVRTLIMECLAQDGIVAFDGEVPAIGPPVVGRQIVVGAVLEMDIDLYLEIQQINAVLGANTRMRGWVLGD